VTFLYYRAVYKCPYLLTYLDRFCSSCTLPTSCCFIRHHLHPRAYADDTQIIPSDTDMLQERMSVCVDEVPLWMASNRLLLNPTVRIGNTSVVPVLVVRARITATIRVCFAALRQICSVLLTREALLTLLRALVITNVDYCCSTLAGGYLVHCCSAYSLR